MKNQTFGVEVEMFNITRENAAKAAAKYFGTNRCADTALRNGYRAWSAWDTQGREWKFCYDGSIMARTDAERCEMVTPILTYIDMDLLQGLVRELRKAGGRSNPSHMCGVHIHIGAAGHTPQTIRNLVNIMAAHEDIIIDALKVNRNRIDTYCKTVDPRFLKAINTKKPQTMAELADVWYGAQGCNAGRTQHYNQSRYHMLNLHATFTKGTIEFRLFQFDDPGTTADGRRYFGGLHAGQLKAYIQLCLAMSDKAKKAKSARPKKNVTDNQKYAMRCWLLNLGFIGDEFKTARDVLTRNLTGNSAWRHGQATA